MTKIEEHGVEKNGEGEGEACEGSSAGATWLCAKQKHQQEKSEEEGIVNDGRGSIN